MITPETAGRILDNARDIELQAQSRPDHIVQIRNSRSTVFPDVREFFTKRRRASADLNVDLEVDLSPGPKTFATPQIAPITTQWTRDEVMLKLNALKTAVKMELHANVDGVMLTGASAGVTAGAGVGALIFSNPLGFFTTVIAGGSGTTGVFATTKDSIAAYISLRSDLLRKLNRCEVDLKACPAGNQAELDNVVGEIKAVYDHLDNLKSEQQQKK